MTRIVMITNDSVHGQQILRSIRRRGVMLDAVLYVSGAAGVPSLPNVPSGRLVTRVARWPKALASRLRRAMTFHRTRRAAYAKLCARVIGTGEMNGRRMQRDLRECAPDWIVLGGGGLLRRETIEIARMGVLNAHPALLPWIRGAAVTGASLEHGVALGCTVHHVDQGIDTGAIIARRLVDVNAEQKDFGWLEAACYHLAAEMMGDVVASIAGSADAPPSSQQSERFPLFRAPSTDEMTRHHALASTGRAHQLDTAWRRLCTDATRGTLPHGPLEAPAEMTLTAVRSAQTGV